MWNHLTLPWQGCFEEAWRAYCKGSLPIGSIIADTHGRILARGRNCIHDQAIDGYSLFGHRLAHAEINVLLQINWSLVDPRNCILFTTTEPCPLCVGAIRMALIGEVRYASHDHIAGSVSLFEATPFLKRGNIKVTGPEYSDLEVILIAMLVEFALTYASENKTLRYEHIVALDSKAARLGHILFESKQLRLWKQENKAAAFVFEQLAAFHKAS